MRSNYLFHGTSLKAAKQILVDGFDGSAGEQIWTVSGGANYFWSLKDLSKFNRENAKDTIWEARDNAIYAAQTAVLQTNCSFGVLFQVNPAMVNYSPDESCPNMQGAVVSYDSVPPEAIEKIWISEDWTYLKPFFAVRAGQMSLRIMPEIPRGMQAMIDILEKGGVWLDSSDFGEMEEITRDEILSM